MSQENPNFANPNEWNFEKSEKEILWDKKSAEVNEIADSLGKGIDENIKEPVVSFLVHEFTTSGSCEGHISEEGKEKHGLPYPWIEIYSPAPEGWEEDEEKKKKWTIENLKQQQKMMGFLEEFYRERETPFNLRLTFDKVGAYGGFRVQSFDAEMFPLLAPEEQKQKLELYRKEISDFSNFLREKYFSS